MDMQWVQLYVDELRQLWNTRNLYILNVIGATMLLMYDVILREWRLKMVYGAKARRVRHRGMAEASV